MLNWMNIDVTIKLSKDSLPLVGLDIKVSLILTKMDRQIDGLMERQTKWYACNSFWIVYKDGALAKKVNIHIIFIAFQHN